MVKPMLKQRKNN